MRHKEIEKIRAEQMMMDKVKRDGMKEDSFTALKNFKIVMDEAGIKFLIVHGLLLGLYREGDMIRNDEHDIDIVIYSEDAITFRKLVKSGKLRDVDLRLRCAIYSLTENKPMIGMIFMKNKSNLGVATLYKNNDKRYIYFGKGNDRLHRVYRFSSHLFDDVGTIKWRNLELPCPKDIEGFLVERYGPDWRTPIIFKEGWSSYKKGMNPCLEEGWGNDKLEKVLGIKLWH